MSEGMMTYRARRRFPGVVGRTDSQPAFPRPASAPEGAPNIHRLAQNGLHYTYFTTTALCWSTRAALTSSRNHRSVGMANITEFATGCPGFNGRQPQSKAGIPATLHQHGYTSWVSRCRNTPRKELTVARPSDRWPHGSVFAFDRDYGFLGGDCDRWRTKLFRNMSCR